MTIAKYADVGWCGDSLGTGNEGFLGAVIMYLQLAAAWRAAFSGSSPRSISGAGSPPPPGVTTFNRGAPTWHVVSVDGLTIQQIRANLPLLPTTLTHIIFEGGTNDCTDQIDPAVSNAQLVGAMGDAIARFPNLQAFFYINVACCGEKYQVVGGVPSFAGNTDIAGIDAIIDNLNALTKASVLAQTGTNANGQPIAFINVDMRAFAILQLAAVEPPPWQEAGYLTVDGRHPTVLGLQTTFLNAMSAAVTVAP